MPAGESLTNGVVATGDDLHALVEAKIVKVFGRGRGAAPPPPLLRRPGLPAPAGAGDLVRVAELLQTRSGFEATVGAMLAVMAAVRRSQPR